ncbi:MAG: hypothetical protein IKI66_02270 [Bacteroidales bacterium]|nr:hypothetical protein [Bacteroidales bacterium]
MVVYCPSILNTFIETYGFEGKTVIRFATSGGSSVKANQDFGTQYLKINWMAGKTLNGATESEIKDWVNGLR